MVKIGHLDSYTASRLQNAQTYTRMLEETSVLGEQIELPFEDPDAFHVWNQFSYRANAGRRDAWGAHGQSQRIGSEICYPMSLHHHGCYRDLGYQSGSLPHTENASEEILHLPIFPELRESEQEAVVSCIREFYDQQSARRAA